MKYQKFNSIIYIVMTTLLCGCATQETREGSKEEEHFVEVKKIEADMFFISLAGSPKTTLDSARQAWHLKASEVCGGVYDSSFSKNLMWQGDLELADPGGLDQGAVYGATGTLCGSGGAIGCMLASLLQGFAGGSNIPKFPVVEGNADCHE